MSDYVKIPELFDYNKPRVESYSSQPYAKKDLAAMLLYEAGNAVDWAQTRRIARNPDNYWETKFPSGSSQIIGKHPSQTAVDALHLTKAIGQPLVANEMKEPYKSLFQMLTILAVGNTINNNKAIGLKSFSW